MRTGYLTPIVKTRLFHIAIAARKALVILAPKLRLAGLYAEES
ncbi:hypothetical protein Q2T83_05365 [Fervidibacter sacchari]|uniref:Uncharacterized protein n=1 Tax=Candidatus Fervidibacter sacchari TaxID=1448929 RepID=A0ABT2EQ42_9BACT|nr:hypothetical protein [Candidatus Fervidibacter sacchari]MCS3919015.1 hypothetical protein [Candidatus Fervidibacter sacchari]WKU17251.1 hypothetical protein Q2T83_05365 [Candidatus Fervidibacter sacchari]